MLLLECKQQYPFTLHLAHVNHNWRKESSDEARFLAEEAQTMGLSFHCKECDPSKISRVNLEAQGRELRIQFFSELYGHLGCSALFLGHQADDQAETVAKRVFEGASLLRLGGLVEESEIQGMRVCRPLLSVRKKALIAYLETKGISYFEDRTNHDPRFLRARTREQLFPFLSEWLGKECRQNLVHLAKGAQELRSYFYTRLGHLLPQAGDLDLSKAELHPLEMEFLLREWLGRQGYVLSRSSLQGVITALLQRTTRKFPIKEKKGWVQARKKIVTIIYF